MLETQKIAFRLILGWEIQICSYISNIFNIWPPAVRSYYLIWTKRGEKGQNSISSDVFVLETQKFGFRPILGWGIQI